MNDYLLLLSERDRSKIRENKENTSAHMQERAQHTEPKAWGLDERVNRK